MTTATEEQLVESYRAAILEEGFAKATERYARAIIGPWVETLDGHPERVNGEWMTLTEIITGQCAPIRDSLVIAAIAPKTRMETLVFLACHPETASVQRRMTAIISECNDHGPADPERFETAIELCENIAEHDYDHSAQAHAIACWLLWMIGKNAEAAEHADTSLILDPENGQAAIIRFACARGIKPAYLD